MQVIKISPKKKTEKFPKNIYLIKNIFLAQAMFTNAFILQGIAWSSTDNIRDEIIPIAEQLGLGSAYDMTKGDYAYFMTEALSLKFPISVIPFSILPQPEGRLAEINKNDILKIGKRVGQQNSILKNILLQAAGKLTIMVNKKIYSSPCDFCLKLFNHIAGECEIVDKAKHNLCHMQLVFNAEDITSEEPSEETSLYDVDLTKELETEEPIPYTSGTLL